LQYDTICSYENTEDGVTLLIKTFNYRLGRAIYASDEGKLVADHEIPNVHFKDVRGMDSTVAEVQKLLPYIKEFKTFARNGNRIPRGILLAGNPGTGKTLLAKAISCEAGVPIIQRNASEFLRRGDVAAAICEDFALARKYAPSILFIDEVDSIAKKRGRAFSMDMVESGLNALLSEMDGFAHDDMRPVFVIAATNFEIDDSENALDPAFVRRFDRRIHVELPNLKGRLDIFRYYLGKHSVAIPDNKLMNLAQRAQGKSPADIELIVEQAYSKAPDGKINMQLLEDTFEKYVYGEKRQWDVEVMRKTSYHEAGHALVSYLTGNTPAYVTNISRGNSGGYMQIENNENKCDYTKQELLDQICISFAGRAAEQLIYSEKGITTGASSDIKRARQYAIMVVSDFAMENDFFLGIDSAQSEKAKEHFDETVRSILAKQYNRAMDILKNNREVLQKLSDALMRENSLNTEQILAIVEAKMAGVDKQEETDMRKEVVLS
jgi:ATP-dependent metalloprotease FtsH